MHPRGLESSVAHKVGKWVHPPYIAQARCWVVDSCSPGPVVGYSWDECRDAGLGKALAASFPSQQTGQIETLSRHMGDAYLYLQALGRLSRGGIHQRRYRYRSNGEGRHHRAISQFSVHWCRPGEYRFSPLGDPPGHQAAVRSHVHKSGQVFAHEHSVTAQSRTRCQPGRSSQERGGGGVSSRRNRRLGGVKC